MYTIKNYVEDAMKRYEREADAFWKNDEEQKAKEVNKDLEEYIATEIAGACRKYPTVFLKHPGQINDETPVDEWELAGIINGDSFFDDVNQMSIWEEQKEEMEQWNSLREDLAEEDAARKNGGFTR